MSENQTLNLKAVVADDRREASRRAHVSLESGLQGLTDRRGRRRERHKNVAVSGEQTYSVARQNLSRKRN